MKTTTFIGIDPALKDFEAALISEVNPEAPVLAMGKFDNNLEGYVKFLKELESLGYCSEQTLICIEHIGPYNEALANHLYEQNWNVWLAQPLIIRQSSGVIIRGKTDKYDAAMICRFSVRFRDKVKFYVPASKLTRQLKDYYRLRKQLVKDRTSWMARRHANQSKAHPCPITQKSIQKMFSILKKEILDIDARIEKLLASQKGVLQVSKILKSIPGIGKVISTRLIIVTGAMKAIENYKQLSTMACCAPFPFESGTSIKRRPRTSKKGDRKLKGDLYMGAMRTTHEGQIFYEYYLNRIAQGKAHNSVINDIINKMLKLAFDLCKRCELFDPIKYIKAKKSLHFT